MNLDLKKRILIPTVTVILLVMGTTTGVNYYLSQKAFKQDAVDSLSMLAKSKTELIDEWIENAKTMISTSSGRTEYEAVLKHDTEETRNIANAKLAEQVKGQSDFSYISIANARGEARASSLPDAVGKIKSDDRDYFQRAMKGEINVSNIYISRTTGKPSFAIAAPIRDGDKIIGVIYGVPDAGKFNHKFVNSVHVGQTGYVYLYDPSGIIFAHKDESLIMRNMNDYDWSRDMLKQRQGVIAYEFQDKKRMVGFAACQSVGWTVVASVLEEEILVKSNRMAAINMVLFVMGLATLLVLLYIIVRSVMNPVGRIAGGLDAGADQVAAASMQVASASQSLAEGISRQAAALEESSASLEDMSSITRQNADNADHVKLFINETQKIVGEV
ncbi:MAG: cache domain-containing protein, partial [Syntrophales bacterium]|nr:cache domain-containing protein [Syntrophales bacterium]